MRWEIENKVISKLYLKEKNIIEPWGIETADSSAFFSLEDNFGYRYAVIQEKYAFDESSYHAELTAQMPEGKWQMRIADVIDSDRIITRKVELETLEDSYFMDFVMRFRFKKEIIEYVIINDQKHDHRNTNIYYQYPVDHVSLKARDFNIDISVLDSLVPIKMQPVLYARDAVNEWVIHARMIPTLPDKEVIKICAVWARSSPLPQRLSNYLLGFKALRAALWYRAERSPYKSRLYRRFLNPCAFGLVKIEKGTRLMWHIKMGIS